MKEGQGFFSIDKSATTFLKGIAILLVLLGHMGYIYKGGSWGASLFLILSGYGVFKSYIKKGTKGYFSSKILKVYLPYLFVTIFILICNYIKHRIGLKNIAFSLLGIDFGYICDKTMWFISFIFLQYIIFYISTIIFKKIKNDNLRHILMIVLNFALNYAVYRLDVRYHIWGMGVNIYLYMFSFSIGILMSKLSCIKVNKTIKGILLSFISFILLLAVAYLFNDTDTKIKYYIYANAIPLLLIILIDLNIISHSNKIINYIGEISFDIYLWEGFLIFIKFKLFGCLENKLLIDLSVIIASIVISQMYRRLFINRIVTFIENKKAKKSKISD